MKLLKVTEFIPWEVVQFTVKWTEKDAREIAKKHGIKVRKNRYSGIDVKYPSGEKIHYYGWLHLRNSLVRDFNVSD